MPTSPYVTALTYLLILLLALGVGATIATTVRRALRRGRRIAASTEEDAPELGRLGSDRAHAHGSSARGN